MTERIMSETTVEYPRLRLRESEIMKIAGHRAHSVGTAICLLFVSVLMIFGFLTWVRDVQIWGNVDTFYFVYWFSFTAVTGFMSYKIAFHVARIAEIDRQMDMANGATKEVTKEYMDDGGAILNYSESSPGDVILANTSKKETTISRYEEPVKMDGQTLTGRMMFILRGDALKNEYRFNRDDVWILLKDEIPGGIKEFKDHYATWLQILERRGYVTQGRNKTYTQRGVDEFLKITPPAPTVDNAQSYDLSRDDDDDDE